MCPEGYEVQVIKSEEKKEPIIRTYQDLIDNNIKINGYYINELSEILHDMDLSNDDNYFKRNIAASEKVAKSMLAMAMISQLMPYYGGEVTNEEWCNINLIKYCITSRNNRVYKEELGQLKVFLAFHTAEQRDNFLKYNEQLVKEYLMID